MCILLWRPIGAVCVGEKKCGMRVHKEADLKSFEGVERNAFLLRRIKTGGEGAEELRQVLQSQEDNN